MAWPKKRKLSKEHKKRIAESMVKYYSNPHARQRMSRIKIKQYKNEPDIVKKIDKAITAWWREHPHIRKKRSEQVKQFFIKHPEKFEKFLEYGKNSSRLNLKTKQGFMVRSSGEKKIADFLYGKKIKSVYEKYTLFFKDDGQLCTPDFWLSGYNCFVEYYGGHPKSWKKKVMKNKLYSRYKIPCVFITPAELRKLDNYLINGAQKIADSPAGRKFRLSKWIA